MVIKKSKRNTILAIIVGVLILGYAAFYFIRPVKDLAYTGYYWLFKWDHFNKGDKMYASKKFIKADKSITIIGIFKLMRPLTLDELTHLDPFLADKIHLDEKKINPNAEPILVYCHKGFSREKMNAQPSTYIGTYLGSSYLSMEGEDANRNKVNFKTIFFKIKPNKNIFLDNEGYLSKYELPPNYIGVDSTLYIFPFDAANTEQDLQRIK
ncbi:MAG: hypothetical protein V4619_00320 [Bacteroidota bacterium]